MSLKISNMAEQTFLRTPTDGDELIVIFKSGANVRNTPKGLLSPSFDVSPLQGILDQHGATLQLLFGKSEERMRQQQKDLAIADGADKGMADMASFYRVYAPAEKLKELAKELLASDQVEAAYVKPGGSDPVFKRPFQPLDEPAPAATPNYIDRQGYLKPAPGGVDATLAWTIPGGGGAGMRVIDCERGWRFTHEDLDVNQGGVISGTNASDNDHGTAVLGIISGDRNAFGITGIAPDATISGSSMTGQSESAAIYAAANKLRAGDVMLLERHLPGPRTPNPPSGQRGFIAIEWWPDNYLAIQYAVRKGIVVVEAAGNGFENLDDPAYNTPQSGFPLWWKNPFNPANPSSGAIIVGAGNPPPGTHGNNHGPDRSRIDFSNYGPRVDVQGWGDEVTSTGYGDLQGGANPDLYYTDDFGGTSSASPIVTGSLLSVQGVLKARGRRLLTSPEARILLRLTGTAQQDGTPPNFPSSQRIGNRPDLRELIPAAAKFHCRSADFDGDGRAEALITSPAGIALMKQNGSTVLASVVHSNGTRLGEWLLNTADNFFGPVANFDTTHLAGAFVSSPWGIGILKLAGSGMASAMLKPNGTRFGGWLLNTTDNSFGPAGDFDGDGISEILVTSPWGVGILKRSGPTMVAPMMASNGTRFGGWLLNTADNEFGPVGDFNGDGITEILVSSPWGIGVLQQEGSRLEVLTMAPNGTRLGDWLLNTADNRFGPVGDFDGDGKDEILVTSPWGIGILKLAEGHFTVPMMKPNGTRFGDWLLNTTDNSFGPARDFSGEGKAGILITSPWGVGILKQLGSTMTVYTMHANGTRFSGGWLLNTANDWLGSTADYDGDGRAEILVTSPWGVGILEYVAGRGIACPTIQANSADIGRPGSAYVLDTAACDFGHGV